ncbi:hypothetical protein CHUAL_004200 [Chamberlinius hualienensis]
MADDLKIDSEPVAKRQRKSCELSEKVNVSLSNFKHFKLDRILSESSSSKNVNILCKVDGGENETNAIVLLEKLPWKVEEMRQVLDETTALKEQLINDIYGTYLCNMPQNCNEIKATIIHPATDKHIEKYGSHSISIINETYEDFIKLTQPYIENKTQFSLQWVDNILTHKSEADRIVFEDEDPINGFILLPDMKWNCDKVEDLYMVAIVHSKSIKSIRDLNSEHLEMLKNIKESSLAAIMKKFNVTERELRVFVHYQPSYYHFHVHFMHVNRSENSAGGIQSTRAHNIDTIISNIKLMPDYYQKVTLTFQIIKNDPLYEIFEKSGKFDKNH